MTRELFGTDGMRGKAGDYPLDKVTIKTVGQAIGMQFAGDDKPILVGQDPRESSGWIVEALTDGLVCVGSQVQLLGVIPTPGVSYLTRQTSAAAGVMVTASHNPYSDNGIKVFKSDGQKLNDDEETQLNRLIKTAEFKLSKGSQSDVKNLVEDYLQFLCDSAQGTDLSGLRIGLDCANGAASDIGPKLFEKLGAEVTALFNQPDGRNINDGCGATNTMALTRVVMDKCLDLGVAVDGDGDRLIMVDSRGRELNGDHELYILAVRLNQKGVVATVMSNYGLERTLAEEGIEMHRTPVGDRYMLDELNRSGLNLAAEQSGHVIINDLQPTGDALMTAVQLLCEVKKSGKSLDRWRDEVEMLPQSVVNFSSENKTRIDQLEIQELIKTQASAIGESGRLLVRASGTEPVVRVMVEGPNAQAAAESIADELKDALAKL